MTDTATPAGVHGGVHQAIPHDSAVKHVTGTAIYTDDIPEPVGMLHCFIAMATEARATIGPGHDRPRGPLCRARGPGGCLGRHGG